MNSEASQLQHKQKYDLPDAQVKVKVERLEGCLSPMPAPGAPAQRPLAVYVEAVLSAHGQVEAPWMRSDATYRNFRSSDINLDVKQLSADVEMEWNRAACC